MIWLDILILILLVGGIIKGGRRGLIRSVIQIFSLILSFTHCWNLAAWLRGNVLPLLDWDPQAYTWLPVIFSFLIIYVSTYYVLSLLTSVLRVGPLKLLDYALGAFLGLVVSIYALGYVFMLVDNAIPNVSDKLGKDIGDIRTESQFYYPIRNSITDLESIRLYFDTYMESNDK